MTLASGPVSILFVEDEPGISSVFAMLLELEGYRVTVASDGLDGLEHLRRETPDLVITDYMMPRMNGMDMIRQIRAEPDHSQIPILLISAAPPPFAAEAMPDAFLQKPMGSERLLAAIMELLTASSADES
jgi:CheY-like chemotaxis protein